MIDILSGFDALVLKRENVKLYFNYEGVICSLQYHMYVLLYGSLNM